MYVNLDQGQGHTEHTFSTLLVITDSKAIPNAEHLAIFTQHFTITLYIFYNYAIYLLKKKNNFNKFLLLLLLLLLLFHGFFTLRHSVLFS